VNTSGGPVSSPVVGDQRFDFAELDSWGSGSSASCLLSSWVLESEPAESKRLRLKWSKLGTDREILREAAAFSPERRHGEPPPRRRRASCRLSGEAAVSGAGGVPVGVVGLPAPSSSGSSVGRRPAHSR